jgi:hypothetical protein
MEASSLLRAAHAVATSTAETATEFPFLAAEAASAPKAADRAPEMNRLAWSLRFASALGLTSSTPTHAEVLKAVALPLKAAAAETTDVHPTAAAAAAWEDFATVVVQQLDATSANAMASAPLLNHAKLTEAIAKRNRKLATTSRTLLPFVAGLPASQAVHVLAQDLLQHLTAPDEHVIAEAAATANFVATVTDRVQLHPLRALHIVTDVVASTPIAALNHARLPIVAEIISCLASNRAELSHALLTQALGQRIHTLRQRIAAAIQPRVVGATPGASAGPTARPAAGTLGAREQAAAAAALLQREAQLLARLVAARVVTLPQAWSIFVTFPHSDFSEAWFATLRQYRDDFAMYGQKCGTDIILNPKALTQESLGTSQIIGNNFALLTFPVARPTWGMTFSIGGSVVPRLTAVSWAVHLVRAGCLEEASGLVRLLRREKQLDDSVALPFGVDLMLCPNTASPFGNVGSAMADAVIRMFMPFAIKTNAEGGASGIAWPERRAEALWAAWNPILREHRVSWACLPALDAIVAFFSAAPLNSDPTWRAAAVEFAVEIFFPSLRTLPPSAMLAQNFVQLASRLPYDEQRQVVLRSEAIMASSVEPAHPAERIEALRQKTLLTHALNRVNSGEPRAFAGLLADVLYGNCFLVANRLLTKAIGYSAEDILLTHALLVRDAPPTFFWVLQILVLEKCHQVALKEDASSTARITAMATYFALVWRHRWTGIDSGYALAYVERVLAHRSRAAILFSTTVLKAMWHHILHSPLEHIDQHSAQQELSLSGGPLARWYGGGQGQSFIGRWNRAVYTPRTLRRLESGMSDALKRPSTEPNQSLGEVLVRRLLHVQAQVVELYQDLPGMTEDILRLTLAEIDTTGDLAHIVFKTAFAAVPAAKRPVSLSVSHLKMHTTAAQSLLLCNEAAEWRECLAVEDVKNENSDKDDDAAPVTATVAPELAPAFAAAAVELSGMELAAGSAMAEFVCLYWACGFPEIGDAGAFDAAYTTASALAATYVARAAENAKRNREDRAAGADGIDGGSSRREYEDETPSLNAERVKSLTARHAIGKVLKATVERLIQQLESAAPEAARQVLAAPASFAVGCLLQRSRVSAADALGAVAFMDAARDIAACAPAESVGALHLSAWLLDVIASTVAGLATFFVGVTGAEAARAGLLVRDLLRSVSNVRAWHGSVQPSSLRRRRVELDAFVAQFAWDVLSNADAPALVHRNVFALLQKIGPMFPQSPLAAAILANAARLHAVPTSPQYAMASSMAHTNSAKSESSLADLVTAAAVVANFAPASSEAFECDVTLLLSQYSTALLEDTWQQSESAVAERLADTTVTGPPETDEGRLEDEEGEAASPTNPEGTIADQAPPEGAAEEEFVPVALARPRATDEEALAEDYDVQKAESIVGDEHNRSEFEASAKRRRNEGSDAVDDGNGDGHSNGNNGTAVATDFE